MTARRMVPAVFLAGFLGCMNVHEELVVMPDGSGKVVLHLTMKAKGEATRFTQAELMACDPDEIQEKVRGLVALTRPESEEKDGHVHLRMTGYFEDLNALKFMDEGEGAQAKPKQEFAFRREGEGFVLEIRGNLLADEAPVRGATDPDLTRLREEFFKSMFAGFEFRQEVRLPGPIASVEGFGAHEGRVATYLIRERDLQKPSDQGKINSQVKFRVLCTRGEVSEGELTGWRKELEGAKAAWVDLRKEMKKAAGKK